MDLETDLRNNHVIVDKIQASWDYSQRLYSTLANNVFCRMSDTGKPCLDSHWSCTWRYAGGLVAELAKRAEGYMDYYCSGNEGLVDPEVEEDLNQISWVVCTTLFDNKAQVI